MKKILLSIGLFLNLFAQAQSYVHQVLIVNEGYYDYATSTIEVPVTVGVYNPSLGAYTEVNTIDGMRFASDAIIVGDAYFVAADQKILKYDLNSHSLLAQTTYPGVRNLAFANGKIVASRGEYLTSYDSYLHVFNATDLASIAAIDTVLGPKWATQNLAVDGNYLYVAVNNGYEWGNEKGIIGRLDMTTLTYGNEIDLGPDGKNPDNLVLNNGLLYTVNNKDWSGSSISKISPDGSINETVNIATASTGCGTSALRDNKLVYQISMETVLNEFDINGMNNVGPMVGFDQNYYELAQEPVSGHLYTSVTDFFSTGEIRVYDGNSMVSSFAVGVSPGTVLFDVRSSAGIAQMDENAVIYPNPFQDNIHIKTTPGSVIVLNDLSGRMIHSQVCHEEDTALELSHLPAGQYLCNVVNVYGNHTIQIINKL